MMLLAATGGSLETTQLPQAAWVAFNQPSSSEDETYISVLADVRETSTAQNAKAMRGIFASSDAGVTWDSIARIGDAAPGVDAGAKFSHMNDPVTSPTDGGIAFLGTIKGPGIARSANEGIWWRASGSPLRIVARESLAAPGIDSAVFKTFESLGIVGNERGPIFLARLTQGVGGVSAANDSVLFGTNSLGSTIPLLREGMTVGGKTVKSFNVMKAVPGCEGSTRSFSKGGLVASLVIFQDATSAVITIGIP